VTSHTDRQGITQQRAPPPPPPPYKRCPRPPPPSHSAAMDPEARRRACVEFRVKLSRDTGVNLAAAACESLLGAAFQGEGGVGVTSLQSNPGLFYVTLGAAIAKQSLPLVLPDHLKVAWWCYREAAEVYKHPGGMRRLAWCYDNGRGVTDDPA